ncbi:hypothetical protein PROFUN_05270 [Planoprotostelium fungivorum]|uniref:Uncharacterized protein n=1 Tax=Planoprotostelium fungivorum TaxID=1890364 RepID=A0A2P6NRH8_9EUKA|nr:hypothetical protein PROFUN_05270 [Planoprotostelium fungivorum]
MRWEFLFMKWRRSLIESTNNCHNTSPLGCIGRSRRMSNRLISFIQCQSQQNRSATSHVEEGFSALPRSLFYILLWCSCWLRKDASYTEQSDRTQSYLFPDMEGAPTLSKLPPLSINMHLQNRFVHRGRQTNSAISLVKSSVDMAHLRLMVEPLSPLAPLSPKSSRKMRVRSRSQEVLNTWEEPDEEYMKQRFEANHHKERRAAIRSTNPKRAVVKEFTTVLPEPKEDDPDDLGSSIFMMPVSKQSSLSDIPPYIKRKSMEFQEFARPRSLEEGVLTSPTPSQIYDTTQLEDGDRLLVGVVERDEVILGGFVDELFFNLTSKRFGKVHILPPKENSSEHTFTASPYVKQFFYTYRYFTSKGDGASPAREVMRRLSEFYAKNTSDTTVPEELASERANQSSVIAVIDTWVKTHFYDFEEDSKLYDELLSLLKQARKFEENSTSEHFQSRVRQWTTQLLWHLEAQIFLSIQRNSASCIDITKETIRQLNTLWDGMTLPLLAGLLPRCSSRPLQGEALIQWIIDITDWPKLQAGHTALKLQQSKLIDEQIKNFAKYHQKVQPALNATVSSGSHISFLEFKPGEVAKQLCLIDFEYHQKVTPKELSFQAWSKSDASVKAPNLTRLIQRSNEMSYWVATEIVLCPDLRRRVTTIKRFIQIADNCRKMNNFSSALSIIGGLNLGAVQKMSKTWQEVPSQYKDDLTELTSLLTSIGNFRTYRQALKAAERPAVPYIAVTLKDLTFIEDGNDNFRANGMVNFEKMAMLASAFSQVQSYGQVGYPFEEDSKLKLMLINLPVILDNNELYRMAALSENNGAMLNNSTITFTTDSSRDSFRLQTISKRMSRKVPSGNSRESITSPEYFNPPSSPQYDTPTLSLSVPVLPSNFTPMRRNTTTTVLSREVTARSPLRKKNTQSSLRLSRGSGSGCDSEDDIVNRMHRSMSVEASQIPVEQAGPDMSFLEFLDDHAGRVASENSLNSPRKKRGWSLFKKKKAFE